MVVVVEEEEEEEGAAAPTRTCDPCRDLGLVQREDGSPIKPVKVDRWDSPERDVIARLSRSVVGIVLRRSWLSSATRIDGKSAERTYFAVALPLPPWSGTSILTTASMIATMPIGMLPRRYLSMLRRIASLTNGSCLVLPASCLGIVTPQSITLRNALFKPRPMTEKRTIKYVSCATYTAVVRMFARPRVPGTRVALI